MNFAEANHRFHDWITRDTTSGGLLLVTAVVAFIWANSPWRAGYAALSELQLGPSALHLNLTLSAWAADGLLAVFFFVVGVELKHELVLGSLRKPREAAVPVLAALGGMLLPAALFITVVTLAGDDAALSGWAIPTATDIAFALAILAIFGRGLPRALRTFLLTLAVVDDLLAIIVIAVFYTGNIDILALCSALVMVGIFGIASRARRPRWWILIPTAIVAWLLMHSSGVHATIAGVLLGATVPAQIINGESTPRTQRFDESVRPFSSGLALPAFAFFAAGVSLVDGAGPLAILVQPVALAIIISLVLGKLIGVLGTTALVTRFTPLRLPDAIGLRDLLPLGLLTGIGFTVSLLITQLSFTDDVHTEGAKIAILIATLIAGLSAALLLRWDARMARSTDMNEDGIPDIDTTPIN